MKRLTPFCFLILLAAAAWADCDAPVTLGKPAQLPALGQEFLLRPGDDAAIVLQPGIYRIIGLPQEALAEVRTDRCDLDRIIASGRVDASGFTFRVSDRMRLIWIRLPQHGRSERLRVEVVK